VLSKQLLIRVGGSERHPRTWFVFTELATIYFCRKLFVFFRRLSVEVTQDIQLLLNALEATLD
jgi:hypothetical protein